MPAKILDKKEKNEVLEKLGERFGIASIPYLLLKTGRERIRGFSGHLSREELLKLMQAVRVEIVGLYFFKEEKNGELRLSLDGSQLLKMEVCRNILEVNDEQATPWLRGEELEVDQKLYGFCVVKNRGDFLGCGKAKDGRLANFIPKERRIR